MNLRLTPLVKNILLINIVVFVLQSITREYPQQAIFTDPEVKFYLYPFNTPLFRPWQLLTHFFMHANIGHLFFNMFAVFMFGPYLESFLGDKKFLIMYMACGIGSGVIYTFINPAPLLGASGAVYGVLMMTGLYFPNSRVMIFPLPIPIKLKYIVTFYAIIEISQGMRYSAGDQIAHFAHVSGMAIALVLYFIWKSSDKNPHRNEWH